MKKAHTYYGGPPAELLEEFAEIERLAALERVTTRGTYETKGDSLLAHHDGAEYIVDGEILGATEYWTPIIIFGFRLLFAAFAMFEYIGEDLSEEELSEKFFAALIESSSSMTPEEEEEHQEFLAQLDAGLQINPLGLLLSLTGTYAIDGDTLFITNNDVDELEPETAEFHRVDDIASAITQTTWGNLKNAHRRP